MLQKQHYDSGVRTCGQVARVLTRSRQHPRGFKVELSDGTIGRVVEILKAPCADGMRLEAAAQLPTRAIPPPPGLAASALASTSNAGCGDGSFGSPTRFVFPTSYPTSALLGCVDLVDCLSQDEYTSRVPPPREENHSDFLFVCEEPRALVMPQRVSGQHKIWQLDGKIAAAAASSLLPVSQPLTAGASAAAVEASVTRPADGAASGAAQGERGAYAGEKGSYTQEWGARPQEGATGDPPLDLLAEAASSALGIKAPATFSLRVEGGRGVQVLRDGFVLLKGALSLEAQQGIVRTCRDPGLCPTSGFYRPTKRSGGLIHMKTMILGDPELDRRRGGGGYPQLPESLWALVREAASAARHASPSIPEIKPPFCLVNYYTHGGRLGLHQDNSERSRHRGSPIVSVSIGDSCEFAYSAADPHSSEAAVENAVGRQQSVRLDSGDVIVFGGPSRMLYHGVTKIHANRRPKDLDMIPGRLNLTFREP